MNSLNFFEFYANVAFDANGQLAADSTTIQFVPNASKVDGATVDIVYPTVASASFFDARLADSALLGYVQPDLGLVHRLVSVSAMPVIGVPTATSVSLPSPTIPPYILAGTLGPICAILIMFDLCRIPVREECPGVEAAGGGA